MHGRSSNGGYVRRLPVAESLCDVLGFLRSAAVPRLSAVMVRRLVVPMSLTADLVEHVARVGRARDDAQRDGQEGETGQMDKPDHGRTIPFIVRATSSRASSTSSWQ